MKSSTAFFYQERELDGQRQPCHSICSDAEGDKKTICDDRKRTKKRREKADLSPA